jgi:hypothetical protein
MGFAHCLGDHFSLQAANVSSILHLITTNRDAYLLYQSDAERASFDTECQTFITLCKDRIETLRHMMTVGVFSRSRLKLLFDQYLNFCTTPDFVCAYVNRDEFTKLMGICQLCVRFSNHLRGIIGLGHKQVSLVLTPTMATPTISASPILHNPSDSFSVQNLNTLGFD